MCHPIELLRMDDEYSPTGTHCPDEQRLAWFEDIWAAMTNELKDALQKMTPDA